MAALYDGTGIEVTYDESARFCSVKLAAFIVVESIPSENVAVTAETSGATLVAPFPGEVETTVTGAGLYTGSEYRIVPEAPTA